MRRREFLKKAGAVLTALPFVGLLGWLSRPTQSKQTFRIRSRIWVEGDEPIGDCQGEIIARAAWNVANGEDQIVFMTWHKDENRWERLSLKNEEIAEFFGQSPFVSPEIRGVIEGFEKVGYSLGKNYITIMPREDI